MARKPKSETEPAQQDECFVMMPISDQDGYDEGHFGHVYKNLIAPACESSNLRPTLASDVSQTNLIHLDIVKRIIEAPMAICDLSSKNPNVMFELGIRQAFDKPVVLIQERGQSPIFDIALLRYVEYGKSLKYHDVLAEQAALRKALTETRDAVGDPGSINSIVRLMSLQSANLPTLDSTDAQHAAINYLVDAVNEIHRELRRRPNREGASELDEKFNSRQHRARVLHNLQEAKTVLIKFEELGAVLPKSELMRLAVSLGELSAMPGISTDLRIDANETLQAISDMMQELAKHDRLSDE